MHSFRRVLRDAGHVRTAPATRHASSALPPPPHQDVDYIRSTQAGLPGRLLCGQANEVGVNLHVSRLWINL